MGDSNVELSSEFMSQYNNAKEIVSAAFKDKKNVVLLGVKGSNGKTYLTNELNSPNYTSLYGLEEVKNKTPLKEKPFILETNNKADLKKLDSFEIPYTLVDMPISIHKY